jgi:flagellar motor switch protein FliN/FliY
MADPNSFEWVVAQSLEQLSAAIAGMTGEKPIPESGSQSPSAARVYSWQFAGIADAILYIAAAEPEWLASGRAVLTTAGIDDADDETALSTAEELLEQAVSGVAQAVTARLGREITPTKRTPQSELPPASAACCKLVFQNVSLHIWLWASETLLALLTAPRELEALPATLASAAAGAPVSRTMELLLDVELPVSVSFGRAQLLLKDVIKLTTGSIVELNRSVNEPVEVIVNNCVIARGEVVVVEGNFGVRIHQVISRQERLRTLV